MKTILKVAIVLSFPILFTTFSCSIKKAAKTDTSADSLYISNNNVATVDTEYYSVVEKVASFQNGDINTFMLYLKKNTRYPLNALKKKQQGTTVVQFGVDCYGSLKIFSVLKSSGIKILDDEAKRAINSSPKWVPAKIKNKSVGQLFMIQVKFNAKTKAIEIK
jgi:TonB family protein